jgi:tRNA threonylcarbamoyladenosine biosynthesis protein TsaB
MMLALDTSTSFASIALVRDRMLTAELSWDVGRRHSVELLPRLRWLLETHGRAWREVSAVGVATGPGSFNGLRVAVTTAKMLALSLGIPVFGVPTLDVIAWGAADVAGPVWATMDAGRGQLYAAAYAAPTESARAWRPLDEYMIVTPAELGARVAAGSVVCGEWQAETERALRAALDPRARIRSPLAGRRAAWLAELALARAAETGAADDPAALEPLYLRRPGITSSARVARHVGKNEPVAENSAAPGGEEAPHALCR